MMNIGGMSGFGGGGSANISQMRDKMFQNADTNGDKGLSLEEFQKAGQNMPGGANRTSEQTSEMFGKIDSDGNGTASQDEMKAFGERMSDQMKGMMINMQSMMGGAGSSSGQQSQDPFSMIDSDGDGNLSREEFDAFGEKMKSQMQGGGGQSGSIMDMLKQAADAYGQNSGQGTSTDFTSTLLKALDGEDDKKKKEAA